MHGFNRLQGGSTGCNNVVDHHYRLASGKIPLNPPPEAMSFGGFAHRERMQRSAGALTSRGHGHRQSHRVRTHRQPTHRFHRHSLLGRRLLNQVPTEFANQPRTDRIHGRHPAIDVKITLGSRGEREVSKTHRFAVQELQEGGMGIIEIRHDPYCAHSNDFSDEKVHLVLAMSVECGIDCAASAIWRTHCPVV